MSQRNSIYLALLGIVIMFVLYGFSTLGMLGDSPVGQTSVDSEPLIVPAGYAFAIWGPIYLGLIAFPIYQFFARKESHPLWVKVRIWFTLNVIANGLWLAFASYNWLWTTVAIIVFMLISLYQINSLLNQIKSDGGTINFWAERLVFSLYFAWVTLATVLNISSALNYYDWNGFGISELNWSIIMLPVAAGVAGAVFWKYRDKAYAAVVIWAFAALVVKHLDQYPVLAYISIGVILVFLIMIFALRPKNLLAPSTS